VAGLEAGFVINIDHHVGNTMYGAVNWFDVSAAACGEMVFDLVRALGVPLGPEIATHIYIAILTDTGSFHYSNISPRTFDICRQCVEAGVHPPSVARAVFDTSTLGRLTLFGAVLSRMEIDASGRRATLSVDRRLAAECGATYEDTEGLINFPLTVKDIQAVAFFKENGPDDWRVSMRSKGSIDINAVAKQFGGGGHKNASGCSAAGRLEDLKRLFQEKILEQIEIAGGNR
jgi:phosphoesterase RecJ-like protein